MVKAIPFIHQPDRVARKASNVSQLIGDLKHIRKDIVFFQMCCYYFTQDCKSLYNTAVYQIFADKALRA